MSFNTPPPFLDPVDVGGQKLSPSWQMWFSALFKYVQNLSGGGGGGVTQITAGTNVTISPSSGIGNVTINASGGGSGGTVRVVQNVATNITAGAAAATDYAYNASAGAHITLPTAVGNTNLYTVKKTDTSAVQVLFTGGQTADGSSVITFPIQNMELGFLSNGTNWAIQ